MPVLCVQERRTMGIAVGEEVVKTVKAILKTLECPICLELLKTPVSAGCGHFFCRECVSGVLQSTYRAPCPLCKRSFTRRSVQEAAQRQSVVSAAMILANTCTSLTGVKLIAQDLTVEPVKKPAEVLSVPSKKFKSSNQENQEVQSRKRKSCENSEKTEAVTASTSDLKTKECTKEKENHPIDEYSSPNKRACPDSDEDDSGDLPSLADLFKQVQQEKNSSASSVKRVPIEKPLSIRETCKISERKTYSSAERKDYIKSIRTLNSSDSSAESKLEKNIVTSKDENQDISRNDASKSKTKDSSENVLCNVSSLNKTNALKNKTNEVEADIYIIENENSSSRMKEQKSAKAEAKSKAKENTLLETPVSRKVNKLRRKSQTMTHKDNLSVRNKMPASENSVKDQEVAPKTGLAPSDKDAEKKDCYTLNQVTLLPVQNNPEKEKLNQKPVEDSFGGMGITDTALIVDAVPSPLASKSVLVHKSPGWSRVKKVKKDFKMKKFTSLHVEKNSPNVSLKSAVASEPESVSPVSKLSTSAADDIDKNKEDSRLENEPKKSLLDLAVKEPAQPDKVGSVCSETSQSDDVVCEAEGREEMDCSVDNDTDNIFETLKAASKDNSETRNVLNTSNRSKDSGGEKISLKTKKLTYEVQRTTSVNNNLAVLKENVAKSIFQENGFNVNKNQFISNAFGMNPESFTLPTSISEYQFHAQSVQNEDNFQYVEQSQQTSQVFNVDLYNPVCNNLRALVAHQMPQQFCPVTEKTKVVKRAALTFEEIQDCFARSNETGCSETLYSAPFLSGLYKLHIGVSDDTLNVSVLKIIDPSENKVAPNTVSLLPGFEEPCNLPPLTEVVPSSNAGSETSLQDNPFPNLSKEPSCSKSLNLASSMSQAGYSTKGRTESVPDIITVPNDISSVNDKNMNILSVSDCEDAEDTVDEKDLEMSEIVHYPLKSAAEDSNEKNAPFLPKSPQLNDAICPPNPENMQSDLSKQSEKDEVRENLKSPKSSLQLKDNQFPTNPKQLRYDGGVNSSSKADHDASDEEESLLKLKQCVSKGHSISEKKQSRLSLKKRSLSKKLESEDESDLEVSVFEKDLPKSSKNEVSSKSDDIKILPSHVECSSPLKQDGNSNTELIAAPSAMPSTLNSILSEDTSEVNASEIVLEIEDLSDKIKLLEEKLKLCGHDGKQNKTSGDITLHDTDSEDSTDLFPQSVPPTPPNKI